MTASQPPLPAMLTVNEVARYLRVSKMSVYRRIHDEELPAVKVGRSFRIPSAGFRTYMQTARTTQDSGR